MDPVAAALERLVARDVLTAEQAEAVRSEIDAVTPARTMPPAAEIAGYLGAVLASVAAIAVVSRYWAQLRPWAQFAILAVVTVALWIGGRWASGGRDPASGRLVGFVWLLSAVSAAGAAWLAAHEVVGVSEEASAFTAAAVATIYGGVLWRARREALQLIAWFLAVGGLVLTALMLLPRPPTELFGLAVWAVGVAAMTLAWGRVMVPVRAAYALGSLTAVLGAIALSFMFPAAGIVLGLGTTMAVMAAGGILSQTVLLGVGTAGLAFFVPRGLMHWFPGSLTVPVAVLVTGLALLAGALAIVRSVRGA